MCIISWQVRYLYTLSCCLRIDYKIKDYKKFFQDYQRASNSLDTDQAWHLSGLIWIQTVCKGYQQAKLACKELIHSLVSTFNITVTYRSYIVGEWGNNLQQSIKNDSMKIVRLHAINTVIDPDKLIFNVWNCVYFLIHWWKYVVGVQKNHLSEVLIEYPQHVLTEK